MSVMERTFENQNVSLRGRNRLMWSSINVKRRSLLKEQLEGEAEA